MTVPWTTRIVGHRELTPDQLLANPKNWRVHPAAQRDALKGGIADLGFTDEVEVQAGTNMVLDGHLRVALALQERQPVIWVTELDLTDAEAAEYIAIKDPLSAMATSDAEKLRTLLTEVHTEDTALATMLADLAEQAGVLERLAASDGIYTAKVETPLYEPTGERPPLALLMECSRHDALVAAIARADLPEEVRAFLRMAATRHVVFDYARIAEFYAHADALTQRLMEDSALVIIDLNRAIELGYARLREQMIDAIDEARYE